MPKNFQTSFAGGELTPSLHERVDLEKYQSALKTARNVFINKTGSVKSRPGSKFLLPAGTRGTDVDNEYQDVLLIADMGWLGFLELGIYKDTNDSDKLKLYTLFHSLGENFLSGGSITRDDTSLEFQDLKDGFDFYGSIVINYFNYILEPTNSPFVFPKDVIINFPFSGFTLGTRRSISNPDIVKEITNPIFVTPQIDVSPPYTIASGINNGAGHDVEYALVGFKNNIGRMVRYTTTDIGATVFKLPVSTTQENTFTGVVTVANIGRPDELRVYRRPKSSSGAYGLVGVVNYDSMTGDYTFTDVGQEADYTQQPPQIVSIPSGAVSGCTYQGRIVFCAKDKMWLSRVDRLIDQQSISFLRDFPYSDTSALEIGFADNIIHVIEYAGLIVFCEDGIYLHQGPMVPANLSFDRQNRMRADPDIPPIVIPGAVLFVDSSTNTIRQLIWDDESRRLIASELSIFSDHLFIGRKVTSWVYQDSETPFLYVSFEDGDYCMFSFEAEHRLRAWTRADRKDKILRFISCGPVANRNFLHPIFNKKRSANVIALVEREDGSKHFELMLDRESSLDIVKADPEYDKSDVYAHLDSMVSWKELVQDQIAGETLSLTPVTAGEWDDDLTLTATGTEDYFEDPGPGEPGTIYRWFNPIDRTSIDLEVISHTNDNEVVVRPSEEFPSEFASNPRLYRCKTTFDGLDHLEGEKVSIMGDGYVLASPNNNIQDYPEYTVTSGEITLPDPYAIVHIGLPITSDVQTLPLASVGQGRGLSYTREESFTCNKVTVKTKDTRGLHVGGRFPADDKLKGSDLTGTNMLELDGFNSYDVNYELESPITGNRYDQPVSKRVEITLPGDWNNEGEICLRNVDPTPFEVLSIVPEIELLGR